jgi:hypothetical protein
VRWLCHSQIELLWRGRLDQAIRSAIPNVPESEGTSSEEHLAELNRRAEEYLKVPFEGDFRRSAHR